MRLTEAAIRRIIRESIVKQMSYQRINEANDAEYLSQLIQGPQKSEDFANLSKMLKSIASLLFRGELNDKTLTSAMTSDILTQTIGGQDPVTVAKAILTDIYSSVTGQPAKQMEDFSNLQKLYKDDKSAREGIGGALSSTRQLADEIADIIDDAAAGDSGAATRAETILDQFTERFPRTSRILKFESMRSHIGKQTPAGIGTKGFLVDVEAVVGFMGGFGIKPSAELLKRADADLNKIMGRTMTLRPGSAGPAVEVSQRLLAIHLDFIGKQLAKFKSAVKTRSDFGVVGSVLESPEDVVKSIRSGKPVETWYYSSACSSASESLKQSFDGKFGKMTYLGTVLLQAYIKLRQEQGFTEGGVLRIRTTNPAELDGVIGSQTLSALLKGNYAAAVSSVAPEKEPEGENLTSGGQGMTDLEEEAYQSALDVFDDVALPETSESPEQVARYRRGLETNLTREKVMAIAKKRKDLNSKQIASVLMSDLNFPETLIGAPGLLPAVAQFVNVTKP
jgi:hypothetical protein